MMESLLQRIGKLLPKNDESLDKIEGFFECKRSFSNKKGQRAKLEARCCTENGETEKCHELLALRDIFYRKLR